MVTEEFFKKYEGIINKVSVKHSIPPNQIKNIISHFFPALKKALEDRRMPKIKIRNLGSFKPLGSQILRSLSKKFYWYRMGNVTRESIVDYIKSYYPILNRLKEEKLKYATNFYWKNIDPENLYESYNEQRSKPGTIEKARFFSRKENYAYKSKESTE